MGERKALVWTDYDRLQRGNDDDPEQVRRFLARQNALKSALSHIEALQKLEGVPTPNPDDHSSSVLAAARAALAEDNAVDEPEADD